MYNYNIEIPILFYIIYTCTMNYSFFISYFWVLSVMIHVLWLRSIVIWIGLAAVSSQPKKVKRWDTNTLSCQLEQLSQDWCNLSHLYLMHSDQRLLVWNIPVGPQIMNNLHVYIHVKMDLTHCILKRNGYIIYISRGTIEPSLMSVKQKVLRLSLYRM